MGIKTKTKQLSSLIGLAMLVTALPAWASQAASVEAPEGMHVETTTGHETSKTPPGPVALTVRLPDPAQKVLYVREIMPVKPGHLTLYYPKWIPGDHAPAGPIGKMMGLEISANGKRIAWHRSEVDMWTFHLTVPAGVDRIDIRFEFPSPDRITPDLLGLEWNKVALYQAGYPTRDEIYDPVLVVPTNWRYASALSTKTHHGGRITFKSVPFNTLVDSPVIAGKYFRQVDLTPDGSSLHRYLDMVADDRAALGITKTQIDGYRRLIVEAQDLFHSHHYDSYHFLLTLSNYVSVGGLEHHQSSDDRARGGTKMFTDPANFMLDASLLPHEYTHSWNGKFMRPAGEWQPNFERPERTQGIWVYEGLTTFLGDMLTARSGLWSPATWREVIAYRAAIESHRPGRQWRPLIDTAVAAQLGYDGPKAWANWRLRTQFYREGELLWLAVDTKILSLSHGKRSLDDFARRFFSVDNGSFVTHTYTFADVVKALNAVQPYDWASYLNKWLHGVGNQVPLLSGIKAAGWRLVYTDKPSRYQKAIQNVGEGELSSTGVNAMFSVGLFLDRAGRIEDVLWKGPAFKAGLAPGMKIVSINGQRYTTRGLRSAIAEAQQTRKPLQIRAEGDGAVKVYKVDYTGGVKYPHLVRIPGTPDYLKQILSPVSNN